MIHFAIFGIVSLYWNEIWHRLYITAEAKDSRIMYAKLHCSRTTPLWKMQNTAQYVTYSDTTYTQATPYAIYHLTIKYNEH